MKIFVNSKQVLRIISQANRFHRLPSEIARITDEYTAFCFDEACDYIISQLEQEKKPKWREDKKSKKELRQNNLLLAEKLKKERR